MDIKSNHICVCICTYKRPRFLERLLSELQNQTTYDLFTYSIVVVDNDHNQSAESTVAFFKEKSSVDINYYNETEQNIALARNKAVENATGNFVAFIDDDEFPEDSWLLNLYKTYKKYKADGVLGPVKPHFEIEPPQWILKGKFFERPSHKTGSVLDWSNTRTGNVLLRKTIFNKSENMFNPEFGSGGEDRDFFRRMIKKGNIFIWCNDAPVYEIVPPERCKRPFLLKRALLRGKVSLTHPFFSVFDIIKSLIAFLLYTLALPFLFLIGHHIFMKLLIKDFDHIGRLLSFCGLDVVKEKYILK